MTPPAGPVSVEGVVVRRARPTDRAQLVGFLVDGGAHISGSRRPAVFEAFLADSFGRRPRTTVAVAETGGVLAAALLAVNGDLPKYYRHLPLRHPRAAWALAAHRARALPARVRRRRRDRHDAPTGTAAHPRSPAALDDEPRLQRPPLAPGEPGPRPSDHGPEIAFCLYLLVGRDHRGRGLAKTVLTASIGHLRAQGATRYDCSFDPGDVAASRLYLSLPFEITRFPGGYFASLDLYEVEAEPLPG